MKSPYIIFIITLLVISQTAVASEAPEDHLHGLGDCAQCHLDGVDISRILLADHSCPQCHKSTELKSMVSKLAKGDYADRKSVV